MWKLCEECCGLRLTDGGVEHDSVDKVGPGVLTPLTRAPPPQWTPPAEWGALPNNMYHLPQPLKRGDAIKVTGKLAGDAREYAVNLISERDDGRTRRALQVKVNNDMDVAFSHESNGVMETLQDLGTKGQFKDDEGAFIIRCEVDYDDSLEPVINVESHNSYVGNSSALAYPLHSIRYVQILGDIEKVDTLSFNFS